MAFVGTLEDRILIRELYDSYADASSRGDCQGWLDCWTEDGLWVNFSGTFRGHAELEAKWPEIWQSIKAMGFFNQMGEIIVDGDSAKCRSWVREIVRTPDDSLFKVVGRYEDQLKRTEAGWRFAERRHSSHIAEGHNELRDGDS